MAVQWIAVLFITATISNVAPVNNDSCQAQITQDPWPYIIGIDGTLKLTCNAINCNTTGARYYWDYTSGQGRSCQENNNTLNTCTYAPTVEDAETPVRCLVVLSSSSSYPTVSATPDIYYPPQDAPKIEPATEFIVNGNTISCSVSGGKPMYNTTVTFTCTNPDLPDQTDVIVGGVVTSVITVDTSQNSTETSMTCTCTATWWEPALYNETVSKSFTLAYPPQDPPKIQLADPSEPEPLKDGTKINCSVSGGKPMDNTTVTFTCTNPDLQAHSDVMEDDVVTSVITVKNRPRSTETNMTCNCSATWGRDPTLYEQTSSMSFAVQVSVGDPDGESLSLGAIAGIAVAVVLFAAFIVVVTLKLIQYSKSGRLHKPTSVAPQPPPPRVSDSHTPYPSSFTLEAQPNTYGPDPGYSDMRELHQEMKEAATRPSSHTPDPGYSDVRDVLQQLPRKVDDGTNLYSEPEKLKIFPESRKVLLVQNTSELQHSSAFHDDVPVYDHTDGATRHPIFSPPSRNSGDYDVLRRIVGPIKPNPKVGIIQHPNKSETASCPTRPAGPMKTKPKASPARVAGPKGDQYTQVNLPKKQRDTSGR